MVDLLGPADAGAMPTLTTTGDVSEPLSGDSWYQDCVGGVAGVGTPATAKWYNRLMQQLRKAIRNALVPEAGSYDQMLSWAMQSGATNWVSYFGGTANALTGASNNEPQTITYGTLIRGIATATNTGAATFNWTSLGALPIVRNDGSPLTGGEIQINDRIILMWDGSAWVLLTLSLPFLTSLIVNPFTTTGVGAVINAFAAGSGPFNLVQNLGLTGTWFYSGGSLNIWEGYFVQFGVNDARWPSSAPPGTWKLQQLTIVDGGGYSIQNGILASFVCVSIP